MLTPLLFLLLLSLTNSQCLHPCATCLNPNLSPQRTQCLSCVNSHVLIFQSCYNCANCYQDSVCDKCNQSSAKLNATSTSALIAIICSIAGLFLLSVLIYTLCTRCFKKTQGRTQSSYSSRMNEPVNYLRPRVYPASLEESNINMNQTQKFIRFEPLVYPQITGWAQTQDNITQSQYCAICLDQNVNLRTRCNHLFHSNCLYQWCIRREATCPLCKSNCIEPLKIFCGKCGAKSVEVMIFQIPNRIGDRLKTCEECRQ